MGYGIANKFIKEVLFWTTLLMHTCIQPNFFNMDVILFPWNVSTCHWILLVTLTEIMVFTQPLQHACR